MRGAKRTLLAKLFRSGVAAVRGDAAVRGWLKGSEMPRPTHILAVGKAAVSMFEGVPSEWRAFTPSLIVTKTGHIGDTELGRNVVALEASHPVPDKTSLIAGKRVLDFVESCRSDSRLLMLVSGGASSLIEHLREGVGYSQLVEATTSALGEGADIAEINRRRKGLSALKGGKLLSSFIGVQVNVLAVSDVSGDGIDVIGSGLGACPDQPDFSYSFQIIASNAVARGAVVRDARGRGLPIVANEESMYADVAEVAVNIAQDVRNGPSGLYLYGGEPTVILPKNPGQGGRNQALALELARHFRNRSDISGLVAGTDGTDGPTDAAGAFFDGDTFEMETGADEALTRANSACYLARTGDQIITGPTGTNVMDLAILIKHK